MANVQQQSEPLSLNAIDEPADDRLFSANFVFATLTNFFYALGGQMMNTTLPMYVLSIGGTNAQAGLVGGLASITALFFRLLIGWVTDVWRRRPIVLIGTSCYGLASVVYAISGSIGTVLFGRVVQGFGISCYSTASNSYVADIAPPRRRAEAIGLFAAANSLGLILGPAVGFYIISLMGYHWLFNFVTGIALVACIVSLFAKEKHGLQKSQPRSWSWRTGILAIDALPIAWTAFCLGMAYSSVTTFIAIFATSRGIENPGLYFTVQAIMLLVSRTFSGRFADKYGRAFTIIPGVIAMSLALAMLPLTHEFLGFMVSAAFMGLGFGTAQPATVALLVDQVHSDRRGLAVATYYMGYDGGMFLGAVVFGIVSQAWGFGIMWPLVAGCVLLGLFGILVASRTHVPIPR